LIILIISFWWDSKRSMASKTFKIVPSNPFFRKDNKEMPLLQSSLTSACHVQGSLNSPSVLKGNYNFCRAVEKNKKKPEGIRELTSPSAGFSLDPSPLKLSSPT
jgi:hypothetical protein